MINNKKRLFEVFEKVNKVNLKEWYDDEYDSGRKISKSEGLGNFNGIDWQLLHEQLMVNTELVAAHKTSEGNLMVYNVSDLTDYDEGLLSFDELKHLEDFDLVYIHDGIPIIEEDRYKDYNAFKSKAAEIWNKEAPIQQNSNNSEAPYLRGRETDGG